MKPLAGRSCLYKEDGCDWQVPQCDQVPIMLKEANLYVRSHSTGFLYNPVAVQETQHRREQEAMERAHHWAAEDEASARRWAAEDKANAKDYDTCSCPLVNWCTCSTARITKERMQPDT